MKIVKFIAILLLINQGAFAQSDTVLVDLDTISVPDMNVLGYRNYPKPQAMYANSYSGNVAQVKDKAINKDDFFPIGWSEDGKYAYAIEPFAENCACYHVEFYIQDLKTNEILWFHQYNNEPFERAWDNATETEKDSLRETFKCFYMKCAWYHVYPEMSQVLFKYNIFPGTRVNKFRENLEDDEKFSHTKVDTLEDGYGIDVDVFFEFDADTIQKSYVINKPIKGVNYHGYFEHNKITPWKAMLLSERHDGLDSSKSETWHYKVLGFKRSKDVPFSTTAIKTPSKGYYIRTNNVRKEYRKIALIEQMNDRVRQVSTADWLSKYGGVLNVVFNDLEGDMYKASNASEYSNDISGYGGYDSDKGSGFRNELFLNNVDYSLDRTFYGENMQYYVYGREKKNGYVRNLTQLLAYNSDSGAVQFWYDLEDIVYDDESSIKWMVEEDSLIYLSVGSDTVSESLKAYGRLLCIDAKLNKVLWQTDDQSANAHSFQVVNDVVITGFSDEEKHYLRIINKNNGRTVKNITMPSKPEWIAYFDNKLYVRTVTSNHEFVIKTTFFESN